MSVLRPITFLSTGDSFTTIATSFHLGVSTVAQIVRETCDTIWEQLKDTHMLCPDRDRWMSIAGQLDVPPPSLLPAAPELGPLPYVVVGDEAFPMKPHLLRPYSGRRLPENTQNRDDEPDEDEVGVEDEEESILRPLGNLRGNRASNESQRIRDTFRRYFNSPAGQVPWQYAHVNRGTRLGRSLARAVVEP
ncbi:protein ALP1-like [Xyrichtys novacula]|uniref:Protein ALP1-like n=1 Tax=Xyrichtys novacula TaxID=13765 RepID=A0AAV1EQJ3_XYRNO|nr:protein ALP1-like [Xyrichtys novacula]